MIEYRFIDTVYRILKKLGVEYVVSVRCKEENTVLTREEFNSRFLASIEGYPWKVGKVLIDDCRKDIEVRGLEATIEKWKSFIGLPKLEAITKKIRL